MESISFLNEVVEAKSAKAIFIEWALREEASDTISLMPLVHCMSGPELNTGPPYAYKANSLNTLHNHKDFCNTSITITKKSHQVKNWYVQYYYLLS